MYESDRPRWYVTEFPQRYEVQLLTRKDQQGTQRCNYHGPYETPEEALEQEAKFKAAPTCEWKWQESGVWATGCGELYCIESGTPSHNKMKFCCYCGAALVERPYPEQIPVEDVKHILSQLHQPFVYVRIDDNYFAEVNDDLTTLTWDEGDKDASMLQSLDIEDTDFYWINKETIGFEWEGKDRTLTLVYTYSKDIDLKQLVEK